MPIKFLEILKSQQNKFVEDLQYLHEYIQSFYKIYSQEIACVKNCDLQYIAATQNFAKLIGVNLPEIILIKDKDLPYAISKNSQLSFKYDEHILKSKIQISFLDISEYSTGLGIYIFNRKPIINPFTKNVLGVLYVGEKYKLVNLSNSLLYMYGNNKKDINIINHNSIMRESKLILGLKQSEVLFCLLLGLREDKAIANFINNIKGSNYSSYTINNAIKELFRKFDTNSRDSLIQIAFSENYDSIIPQTLIKCGTYPINYGYYC